MQVGTRSYSARRNDSVREGPGNAITQIAEILKRGSSALSFAGSGVIAAGMSAAGEIAINGHDPVAYFTAGKAQQGIASFSFPWRGMTWHFLSKENRDLFAATPEKYAPQYDGYCAWAMTEERKAMTDPEFGRWSTGSFT